MKNKFSIFNLRFLITRGFTLIELLIVIAVVGILAAGTIAVINPVTQFQKAQDARRKADLNQIQKALETYYQDNGAYPSSSAAYQIVVKIAGTDTIIDWGSTWMPYMGNLPKDPADPAKKYVYYSNNRQTYYLYASLDRGGSDPQACSGGICASLTSNGIPANACASGSIICNYGVSSPDVSP